MNQYISKLIELGKMVGGRITFNEGFASFERLSKEELEALPESERAYATTAMGRAVFQIGEDGKIVNYKGVDSHLSNDEIGLVKEVGALPIECVPSGENYVGTNYPLNLVLFLDKENKLRTDVRIRGASPLEDLEIEADVNSRMQGKGIKLPTIREVKEFPQEMLKNFGLPTYVDGSFTEFVSTYETEDIARKSYLKAIMGDNYQEQHVQGQRPETMAEYLKSKRLQDNPRVQAFLKSHGVTVEEFSQYVDKTYSRGQRYGQSVREMESPFRIADIEMLLGDAKNLPAIEAIVGFTESMHPDRGPFENYFARQLGANLGNMMNNGWECENFSHRQDYTLTGEMCDDSYEYAPREINQLDERQKEGEKSLDIATTEKEKADATKTINSSKAGKTEKRLKFFTQIYLLSSNIKVLQDEMRMRGKSQEEIDSVLSDFLDNFHKTVDLERASCRICDRGDIAKKALDILVRTPKDMAALLAFKPQGPDKPSIDEEVLRAQEPFNAFFDEVNTGLGERFHIDRSFMNETRSDVKGINPYEDFGDDEMSR